MPSILDPIPNSPFYYPQTNSLSTPQGSVIAGSGVSVDQFGVMNVASALGGTVTSITAGTGLTGGTITVSGTLSLVPATNVSLGGIKVGANLLIAPDGTLSALPPGTGTVSSVSVGSGLTGGGTGPAVSIALSAASTTQFGGVTIGSGINSTAGLISIAQATTGVIGGVQLATGAEVITGTNATKAITPATLAAKSATTSRPGIVQLSDAITLVNSTLAATPTAVKTVYDAAVSAQSTANAALSRTGGTMTGIITFAAGQTFPGVAFPTATTNSLGVVQVGSGLSVNSSGVLSTVANGTVTSVVAGPGLGAPATGNVISTTGTLRLVAPTGTSLGGVKQGSNINIGVDGTISVPAGTFISTNNQYAFNGYQWPISNPAPALPCPGTDGQVLTIANSITGQLAWASTGTLNSVVAGSGISVASTATSATVSLATVGTITPGSVGATGLIPTFAVNAYGQITSTGLANPYAPFQTATTGVPASLTLDFADNNTNWEWTLTGNITIQNPQNTQSGQRGSLILSQDPTPRVVTWGAAWKNLGSYAGPAAGQLDLIDFVVVSGTRIVVTSIASNIA